METLIKDEMKAVTVIIAQHSTEAYGKPSFLGKEAAWLKYQNLPLSMPHKTKQQFLALCKKICKAINFIY